MSLTVDEQDCINLRLRRAQAIMVLIAVAAKEGVDKQDTIGTAAYLADELVEEAHNFLGAACSPKRKRIA